MLLNSYFKAIFACFFLAAIGTLLFCFSSNLCSVGVFVPPVMQVYIQRASKINAQAKGGAGQPHTFYWGKR